MTVFRNHQVNGAHFSRLTNGNAHLCFNGFLQRVEPIEQVSASQGDAGQAIQLLIPPKVNALREANQQFGDVIRQAVGNANTDRKSVV